MNAQINHNALTASKEERFDWPVCYQAEEILLGQVTDFLDRNSFARQLAQRLRDETGTLLIDWVDYLTMSVAEEAALREAGFADDSSAEDPNMVLVLYHPEALLPRVLLTPEKARHTATIAIRSESLEDFQRAHRINTEVSGQPLSQFRQALIAEENGARLMAVERRGYRGFLPMDLQAGQAEALLTAREMWQHRKRVFADSAEGYRHTHSLLDEVLELVGRDLACHIVFEGERAYWQSRNRAAQVQKQRQDGLGLGWANHDHHTFRSSREHFLDLLLVMEKLGFERRERFYAGAQAGWGAQILEQHVEGIIVFADLDLLPGENEIDFSRSRLPPAPKLGTLGLWVGLHGESFLEAGMHHLEARFDFTLVRDQLKMQHNIIGMPPFSDFEFLKQAFTEGERWPVRPERVENLRRAGLISDEQARRFVSEGAIGSHLETLQRRGGFKGFNQTAVSAVIQATDPRKQALHAA